MSEESLCSQKKKKDLLISWLGMTSTPRREVTKGRKGTGCYLTHTKEFAEQMKKQKEE